MHQPTPNRQFQIALERARANWAAVNPAQCAALAGCVFTPGRVSVPFFGAPHEVSHPAGEALSRGGSAPDGRPAHSTVTIALLHYLLTADGTPPADRWLTFRELPNGMFYAQAFAGHEEAILAQKFGADLPGFRRAAEALHGTPLDLADASYRFQALPRVAVAVLLWEGDDEFPGQARVLFDANADHYLPTEDLSGLGDWLAHRLTR